MKACTLCVVLAMACSGSKGDSGGPVLSKTEYLEQYPSAFCSVMQTCDPDVFEASYAGDLQTCIDEITTWGRDRLNQECGFDGGAAGSCVESLDDVSCSDWAEGTYQETCGAILNC